MKFVSLIAKRHGKTDFFILHIADKTQYEFIGAAINVQEYMYVPKFYITNRESINIRLELQGKVIEPNHLSLRN
jgi:hypothetical protein